MASRSAPTGRCGWPTTTTSSGSPRPACPPVIPAVSTPPSMPWPSPPAPTARCGSPTTATTRSGGSPPPGSHQLHRPGIDGRCDHVGPGRRVVVHQLRRTTRSGGSPPPGSSPTSPHRHRPPDRITAGPDGALWFTNYGTTPSGASPPPGSSPTTPARHREPEGSPPGPTGPCGSPTDGSNSIGRITTAGVVTDYTDAGIADPTGSPPGLTAPCGSPTAGSNSIGRITTAGVVTIYTGSRLSATRRDHRRPRRGAVVHQLRQQLDRADHHRRGRHPLQRPCNSRPQGITAGPDGALWFTN